MGADGVVDDLPGLQLAVEGGDVERRVLDLVELLGVGALGALDVPIELRRSRGQEEE
jgi:hypothetical protein